MGFVWPCPGVQVNTSRGFGGDIINFCAAAIRMCEQSDSETAGLSVQNDIEIESSKKA